MEVDLLCKALGNGAFRGRIVVDGVPDPDLHVDPGTCEDLRQIWIRARDKYQVAPSVGSDCVECFPPEFLEAESEPAIDRLDRNGARNDDEDREP